MATCSEDGHAPWVECERGKGWTKKKPGTHHTKDEAWFFLQRAWGFFLVQRPHSTHGEWPSSEHVAIDYLNCQTFRLPSFQP